MVCWIDLPLLSKWAAAYRSPFSLNTYSIHSSGTHFFSSHSILTKLFLGASKGTKLQTIFVYAFICFLISNPILNPPSLHHQSQIDITLKHFLNQVDRVAFSKIASLFQHPYFKINRYNPIVFNHVPMFLCILGENVLFPGRQTFVSFFFSESNQK